MVFDHIVLNYIPIATYVHCTVYVLNLAVSKFCSLQPLKNCLGTIEKTWNFLVYLNEKIYLHRQSKAVMEPINAKTLKLNCAVR